MTNGSVGAVSGSSFLHVLGLSDLARPFSTIAAGQRKGWLNPVRLKAALPAFEL